MNLQTGQIVEAAVKRLEPYGIYLDHNGETLLVLIPETSWVLVVRDCRDFAKVGDVFKVKILGPSTDGAYYGASIKQARPEDDPWRDPSEFAVGSRWKGRVTRRITMSGRPDGTFGYIVEIKPGVSGLIKTKDGGPTFTLDETVEVIVEGVDLQRNEVLISAPSPAGLCQEQ